MSKNLKKFVFAAFLLFLLLLSFIPSILSTGRGTLFLLSFINHKIPGTLDIENTDLSWFGKQNFYTVTLKSETGESILAAKQVEVDAPLFVLLFNPYHFNHLRIEDGNLTITQDQNGITDLQDALGIKKMAPVENKVPVYVEHADLEIFQGNQGALTAKGKGTTRHNQIEGTFSLDVSKELMQLQASHFPTLVLDQMVAIQNPNLSGLLVKTMGDTAEVQMTQKENLVNFIAKSSFMQMNIQGNLAHKTFTGTLNFNIPQESGENIQLNLDINVPGPFSQGIFLKGNARSQNPLFDVSFDGVIKEVHSELNLALKSEHISIPELIVQIPFLPFEDKRDSIIHGTMIAKHPDLHLPIGVIHEMSIPWILDLKDNSLRLNLVAKRNDPEPKPVIQGAIRIDEFMQDAELDIDFAKMQLNLKIDEFETESLQPYVAPYPVKKVLGPHLELEITLAKHGKEAIEGCIEISPPKSSHAFIKRIYGKFEIQNGNLTFQAETQQAIGATNFSGTFRNLFSKEGKVDLENSYVCFQGHLKHFPVGIMGKALAGDEKMADTLEAIFGSQVEGDIYGELVKNQGIIRSKLKGLNGEVELNAAIEEDILLLNEPLTASFKVTPQLEQAVLRQYLPILGSVIHADNPIELTIPKEGFSLPLQAPSLSTLQFQNAELKLGKMLFVKESPLGKIISVLGIQSPQFIVWFTPIYFSLENGIIQMYRTDLLIADTYPTAAWGIVDLNQDLLDLRVALSGSALKRAFGINAIENNTWLQVPISGDIHHPKINATGITARISALAALSKTGSPGKLVGSLIDSASDLIGQDAVPDPTTSPLPWQDQLQAETCEESPIDDLKKGAKKILKGLFQ